MNEQDLRALVREAVERHLGHFSPVAGSQQQNPAYVLHGGHSSHILLNVAPGSAIDEGACLIEPAVRCNHCGYCQSLGH